MHQNKNLKQDIRISEMHKLDDMMVVLAQAGAVPFEPRMPTVSFCFAYRFHSPMPK